MSRQYSTLLLFEVDVQRPRRGLWHGSLGLGTTIIGLIPPIVDRSKTLRQRYNIPKENKVLSSLILGYPRYRYKKSIHRDLAGVQMM